MPIIGDLLKSIPEGKVLDVRIGLHWTAVVVEVNGMRQCGLASTLSARHDHHKEPDIPKAGQLLTFSARELAYLSMQHQSTQTSLGIATLNALLPRHPHTWREDNAEEVISMHGKGKRVVLIGRFPFIPNLRSRVKELLVLEQDPGPEDLPAESAPNVLPRAEVVAITGMTLLNQTLEDLLKLCSPEAFVILLGPSTPLSPVLFDYGVDILSGSVVMKIDPVLSAVSEGGNFRQIHGAGVKLVNVQQ
jgi:uncharacterized protein (DUF4213/DUF364 family)